MGLSSALGAASGDLTYALVALTAGARVLPVLMHQSARIQVGADLVLIVFGVWMAWSARHGPAVDSMESNASAASTTSAFRTTYALTVINPLTVIAFMAFAPQLGMSRVPKRGRGGGWPIRRKLTDSSRNCFRRNGTETRDVIPRGSRAERFERGRNRRLRVHRSSLVENRVGRNRGLGIALLPA